MKSQAERRIESEIKDLKENPPQGFSLEPEQNNIFVWNAIIQGPKGTPYEGGKIKVKIYLPENYPLKPPIVIFTPSIFHLSVEQSSGQPSLKELYDWHIVTKLKKIITKLIDLLKYPSDANTVEEEFSYIFRENRDEYDRLAREWTIHHAV